jgi:hypothetical protein
LLVIPASIEEAWTSSETVIENWGASQSFFYKYVVPDMTVENSFALLSDLRVCSN